MLQRLVGDDIGFSVDLDSGEEDDLTPYDSVQVQVIHHDKRHPNELLVAMNKENERVHDVYRLELSTKQLEMVAKNPGNVAGWVVDAEDQL